VKKELAEIGKTWKEAKNIRWRGTAPYGAQRNKGKRNIAMRN
jgi:hypothetical protein